MPSNYCLVPVSNNRGRRLFPTDKIVLEQWRCAIRLDMQLPSKTSIVSR